MIIDINNITEEDLDLVYLYLSGEFDSMSDEDKLMWTDVMKLVDKNFSDNEDSNS
jgi:hypothetical protein